MARKSVLVEQGYMWELELELAQEPGYAVYISMINWMVRSEELQFAKFNWIQSAEFIHIQSENVRLT
jgi:hypothetical protein